MSHRTATHELDHVLTGATALCQLEATPDQYKSCRVHFYVNGGHGEASIEPPDSLLDSDLIKQAAAISALGPTASSEPQKLVKWLKKADVTALRDAGDLSQQDLRIAAGFDGPFTSAAVCLFATAHLKKRLGLGGQTKLIKVLKTASNQNTQLGLADVCPKSAAMAALRVGRRVLQDIIDPAISREEARKMTPAQRSTRRVSNA